MGWFVICGCKAVVLRFPTTHCQKNISFAILTGSAGGHPGPMVPLTMVYPTGGTPLGATFLGSQGGLSVKTY